MVRMRAFAVYFWDRMTSEPSFYGCTEFMRKNYEFNCDFFITFFLSLVFKILCSFFYTGSVLNIHIFVGFNVQAFLFNFISFLLIRSCWTTYHFIIICHVFFSIFSYFTSENTMSSITCFIIFTLTFFSIRKTMVLFLERLCCNGL